MLLENAVRFSSDGLTTFFMFLKIETFHDFAKEPFSNQNILSLNATPVKKNMAHSRNFAAGKPPLFSQNRQRELRLRGQASGDRQKNDERAENAASRSTHCDETRVYTSCDF